MHAINMQRLVSDMLCVKVTVLKYAFKISWLFEEIARLLACC